MVTFGSRYVFNDRFTCIYIYIYMNVRFMTKHSLLTIPIHISKLNTAKVL